MKKSRKLPKSTAGENVSTTSLTLVEAAPRSEVKLDLGCGLVPKEGFEGVDIRGGKAKHVADLFKFPWPFKDSSVDEIHASHLLEHVPAREVEERDFAPGYSHLHSYAQQFLGQDMLFAFMDECYRILKPDCWMHVVVPSGRSNRAFWDPTHRRFFMQETFLYFAHDWRKMNGLDHYRVKCNFGVDVGHSMPQEESLRSAEAQAQRFHNFWNVTTDWIAKLKKLPLTSPAPDVTSAAK
jgi:predicted SAM-dependent methyltransferase